MLKKKLITIILPAVASSLRDIVRGVTDYAKEQGDWHLILHLWGNVSEQTYHWIQRGDGLIFASPEVHAGREKHRWNLPAVAVQSAELARAYPLVTTNYAEVGRLAADHFEEKGLLHCAYLGYKQHRTLERGFREAAEKNQRPFSACHLASASPELDLSARKALLDWLDQLTPPVGLLVESDFLAQRIMDWIPPEWMPERIALLGVGDDSLICPMTSPTLSSIARGARKVGYHAAEVLDRLMAGESVPPGRIDLPPERVVERESTGLRYTTDPLVTRAIYLLEENLSHPLSTDQLCARLNTSRRTLERRFREALRKSPREERQFLQVIRAKDLLSGTREPMSVIAADCGYTNQQRFAEAFRKAVGVSPSKYRRLSLSGEQGLVSQ